MPKYEGAPPGPYAVKTYGPCIGIFNSEGEMLADLTDCSYSKLTAPLFADAPMLTEQNEKMLDGIKMSAKMLQAIEQETGRKYDTCRILEALIAEIEREK